MPLFPWQKQREFLSRDEKAQLVEAIQQAEHRTSGEVRVYVESRCRYVDPLDRAKEVFHNLKMGATELHNATLVYVAVKDRQAAVYGDAGIHEKVGQRYWEDAVNKMLLAFRRQSLAHGLLQVIKDIGDALQYYFPYDSTTDKNELPDDIVFGR